MSNEPTIHHPDDDGANVGDRNVERLLSGAYQPETPDPAFVEQTLAAVLAAAARRRAAAAPAPRRDVVRRLLALAVAAGLLVALGIGIGSVRFRQRDALRDGPMARVEVQTEQLRNGENDAASAMPAETEQPGSEDDATADVPASVGLTAKARAPSPPPSALAPGKSLETGADQRRRVALDDGSVLYLNENTAVTLDSPRHVTVHRGEVFVEVAGKRGQNSFLPFIVATPDRQVTALGTKFGVRVAPAGTNVVVTQGKVAVSGLTLPLVAGQQLGVEGVAAAPRASYLLDWTRELVAAAESPLVPGSQYAGGALVAVDPRGQESRLSLRRYHVDVYIEDGFARTTIDQTYFNRETSLEGTFYFPLPADASLSRLAMYVNGRLMEGGMAEREYARQVFETIVYRQKDPALLEWIDGSTFKMRVFPLEGRQEKRIILSYTQKLPSLYGRSEYRFPGGHNLQSVDQWSAEVRVKDGANLAWKSPSHDWQASHEGSDLVLSAAAWQIKPDRDVVVTVSEFGKGKGRWGKEDGGREKGEGRGMEDEGGAGADRGQGRFSSIAHEGSKYLMLRWRPTLPARRNVAEAAGLGGGKVAEAASFGRGNPAVRHRHWVFLFESSGDRDPLLARAQVDVIKTLLENVEHDDTFSIVTAGTHAEVFGEKPPAEKPLAASPENVKRAVRFLEQSHLIGALDLEGALKTAGQLCQAGKDAFLVHVGSGVPVLGRRDIEVLVKEIPECTHYVGVGVGKRWARNFMKTAAARTGGYFTQINPDEQIAWRAFDLLATLNTPRLLNIKVGKRGQDSFPAGKRSDARADLQSEKSPDPFFLLHNDSLAQGEELCAIARFDAAEPLPGAVEVTGLIDGKLHTYKLPVADVAGGAAYLPRTWAKLEIDRLVAEGAERHKPQIIELSKAMYVMSPFTSLLVLEDEQMYVHYRVDRGRKDHWAMYDCPDQIPVVYDPAPPLPPNRPMPATVANGPAADQAPRTIVVRTPLAVAVPTEYRQTSLGLALSELRRQPVVPLPGIVLLSDGASRSASYDAAPEPVVFDDGVLVPKHTVSIDGKITGGGGLAKTWHTFELGVTSTLTGRTELNRGINGLAGGRHEFSVPILTDMPYLNGLFKNSGIGRETQSLTMMVTPRIIIQDEEEEKLGTADAKTISLKQEVALQQFAALQQELMKVRFDLQRARKDLSAAEAELLAVDNVQIHPFQLDAYIRNDPQAKQLFDTLTALRMQRVYLESKASDALLKKIDHGTGPGWLERGRFDLAMVQAQLKDREEEFVKAVRDKKKDDIEKERLKIKSYAESLVAEQQDLAAGLNKQLQKAQQLGVPAADLLMLRGQIERTDGRIKDFGGDLGWPRRLSIAPDGTGTVRPEEHAGTLALTKVGGGTLTLSAGSALSGGVSGASTIDANNTWSYTAGLDHPEVPPALTVGRPLATTPTTGGGLTANRLSITQRGLTADMAGLGADTLRLKSANNFTRGTDDDADTFLLIGNTLIRNGAKTYDGAITFNVGTLDAGSLANYGAAFSGNGTLNVDHWSLATPGNGIANTYWWGYTNGVSALGNALVGGSEFTEPFDDDPRSVRQVIQSEVSNLVNGARAQMATDPEGASQYLKLALERLRQAPELDLGVKFQLYDVTHAALREAARRAAEEDQRRWQRSESLAAAKERVLLSENLLRKEQKLHRLVERFNSLMDEDRYRAMEAGVAAIGSPLSSWGKASASETPLTSGATAYIGNTWIATVKLEDASSSDTTRSVRVTRDLGSPTIFALRSEAPAPATASTGLSLMGFSIAGAGLSADRAVLGTGKIYVENATTVAGLTASGAGTLTLNGGSFQLGGAYGSDALAANSVIAATAGGVTYTYETRLAPDHVSNTSGALWLNLPDAATWDRAAGDGTTTAFAGGALGTAPAARASVGVTSASGGTLILTGANTYTGATMINAGTLTINSPAGSYALSAGGGTLDVNYALGATASGTTKFSIGDSASASAEFGTNAWVVNAGSTIDMRPPGANATTGSAFVVNGSTLSGTALTANRDFTAGAGSVLRTANAGTLGQAPPGVNRTTTVVSRAGAGSVVLGGAAGNTTLVRTRAETPRDPGPYGTFTAGLPPLDSTFHESPTQGLASGGLVFNGGVSVSDGLVQSGTFAGTLRDSTRDTAGTNLPNGHVTFGSNSDSAPPFKAVTGLALFSDDSGHRLWQAVMRDGAAKLIDEHSRPGVIQLARKVYQAGDRELADELLDRALKDMADDERWPTTLAAAEFLVQTNRQARADALLLPLLDRLADEEPYCQWPWLWRLAAAVADRRGLTGRALTCLERAMELEYAKLPDKVNLETFRTQYADLMRRYQQVAATLAGLEPQPPRDFLGRVVRAADRWRAIDPDPTAACQAAAKVFEALGAPDLAWDYLTTPLALRPNEAAPWAALGETLRQQQHFDLADRAYASAFEAEPTNGQILWDRAQLLLQNGRAEEGRKLLRQLSEGEWPPAFSGVKARAAQEVKSY